MTLTNNETLLSKGSPETEISEGEMEELVNQALSKAIGKLNQTGPVLILPPDITRFHSRAGVLTDICSRQLGSRLGAVMPALGTHMPMSQEELKHMFPNTPLDKFRVHDWRNDITELGRIDADWVEKTTHGKVRYDWPVQVNKLLRDGGFSLIISIGQVVPHEVAGLANHLKNIFVGTGGKEAIDKSHFAGASYGMERMMGRIDTPVRLMFDEGYNLFGQKIPPILYILTVIGPKTRDQNTGSSQEAVRGLYIGFGRDCFEKACELSRKVNIDLLEEPINKAIVYLDPKEFRTTWLGNKAVYRTRMAMADNAELLVLAPGLERFGEDLGADKLIRKYGYRPTEVILEKASKEKDISENLSAAAHLIHGSSEGRFLIRYCPGPKVSRSEIESVGYEWGDLKEAQNRYNMEKLALGWNTLDDGERVFFISNPALGLWAERQRFMSKP